VYLPVSVRAERLGVLAVTLPICGNPERQLADCPLILDLLGGG
jgi:hypothetical protein